MTNTRHSNPSSQSGSNRSKPADKMRHGNPSERSEAAPKLSQSGSQKRHSGSSDSSR